jgi:hypothetical protein
MLDGVFLQMNSTYQTDMEQMLTGTGTYASFPAWQLLLTPDYASQNTTQMDSAGLFNSTADLFSWSSADYGYTFANDNNATAWGEILLFMLGIVPSTTTIAFPVEQLNYEDIYTVDPIMLAMNMNSGLRQISIPVVATGTITFDYGTSPVSYTFPSAGLYTITFTKSWNMILYVSGPTSLATNVIYFYTQPPVAIVSGPSSALVGSTIMFYIEWQQYVGLLSAFNFTAYYSNGTSFASQSWNSTFTGWGGTSQTAWGNVSETLPNPAGEVKWTESENKQCAERCAF